ncbi:hypothetical protein C1A50_4247 [Paenibacillus polymyxa]|nr:hypothetical protein C1A50_4247 [Paenibacillus polymyxa]
MIPYAISPNGKEFAKDKKWKLEHILLLIKAIREKCHHLLIPVVQNC